MKKNKKKTEAARVSEPEIKVHRSFVRKDLLITVAALVIMAFLFRVDGFKKEHPLSFDEQVYPFLAMQMIKAPGTYNTIAIYEDSLRKGRQLPEYFKMPLFKHPPLFPWLLSEGMTFLGGGLFGAFKVSLFFGVLLIGLAYFLGAGLFDSKTGMWAAAIMFIEPVSWIVSQKIWVETTLAFFTILSLSLFAMSIKKYNPWLVIASALAAGLAALCKYPGMLATGVIFFYAVLADRELFKKKTFLAGLFIPFAMLAPWFVWNYKVYGAKLLSENVEIVHLYNQVSWVVKRTWWIAAFAGLAAAILAARKDDVKAFYEKAVFPRAAAILWILCASAAAIFAFVTLPSMVKAFIPSNVPEAGWKMNMFLGAPWHFYLGRLIELSPFYILSLAGLLLPALDKGKARQYTFIFLASFAILGLYILWGNYQSRYITAATVLLVVVAARVQSFIFEKAGSSRPAVKNAVIIAFVAFIVYAAAKTVMIDIAMAVPNKVCYF